MYQKNSRQCFMISELDKSPVNVGDIVRVVDRGLLSAAMRYDGSLLWHRVGTPLVRIETVEGKACQATVIEQ